MDEQKGYDFTNGLMEMKKRFDMMTSDDKLKVLYAILLLFVVGTPDEIGTEHNKK